MHNQKFRIIFDCRERLFLGHDAGVKRSFAGERKALIYDGTSTSYLEALENERIAK